MEESSLQVHVFASLYSFSDGAISSEKAAFINAQAEWRDNKVLTSGSECYSSLQSLTLSYQFLLVSSNDEASVTALLNLYNEYINNEKEEQKQKTPEPYEVSKLERPPATLTKKALASSLSQNNDPDLKDLYRVEDSSKVLVTHETRTRVWFLAAENTPKRLTSLKLFEQLANRANCRIMSKTEAGVITVKGDNDQDLSETMRGFDNYAQALVLRQSLPQIHNLVIPEDGIDSVVRFRITPLTDYEASDQRSTTLVDQRLLYGTQPNLAVILKAARNGVTLTCSRFIPDSSASTTLKDIAWRYTLIPSYGNQDINLADSMQPTAGSHTQVYPPSQLASTSIDKWIATIPHGVDDPCKPVDRTEETTEEDNDTGIAPPKKRFGRNRKKPGLDDIAELEVGEEEDLKNDDTSLHSTIKSSSELVPHQDTAEHGLPTQPIQPTQVVSTLVSKTPSHSGSPMSPLADTSSSTPSTQSSSKHSDLLALEELDLSAYPVMIPVPASYNQQFRSQASEASAFSSPSLAPPAPAWVQRNVTSQAENKRPGLLIDCGNTERPNGHAVSYVAAAKRGISVRGRGSSRATRGGKWNTASTPLHQPQPPASISNQAQQPSSQVVEWVVPKAAHKAKMPKAKGATTAGQTVQKANNAGRQLINSNPSQPDDPATIQLLTQANTLGGLLAMEVQIGRILVQTDSVQTVKVYNAWASIFDTTNGAKTETIFTNRLPDPHTSLGFPSNLKEPSGQPFFTNMPHDCSVKYQFLCSTILGDEDMVLEVSESGAVQIFSEHVVGAFQWHFPKRQWDARLVVKTSERIQEYEKAIHAVKSSLAVIPSPDQATASLFANLGNSGLIFKSASILREVHFRCLADLDISISCTETQHLGPANGQRFFNGPIDRTAAEARGDLWWEMKLESTSTSTKLQQANWTAEEIVQAGTAQRLQAVAIDVVTQIDGIGSHIKQAATAEASSRPHQASGYSRSLAPTESWRASKKPASHAATFCKPRMTRSPIDLKEDVIIDKRQLPVISYQKFMYPPFKSIYNILSHAECDAESLLGISTDGMAPPPAKRRRKLVVLSSEDEDEEDSTNHEPANTQLRSATQKPSYQHLDAKNNEGRKLPTRLRSKPKPVTKAPPIAPLQPINKLLPKKSAPKQHNNPKDSKSLSLDTYFSNAHAAKSAGSQTSKVSSAVEEEDFIEDDSLDEELQKISLPRKDLHKVPTQAQARPNTLTQQSSSKNVLSGSQVFRKLGNGIAKTEKKEEAVTLSKDDTRPWADRYGPVSLEELAVHKKKVADVRDWLYNVFQGRSKKKVLILKGASGVGKTATVSALSGAMDFDLIEWANPTVSDYTSDNYISTTALFEEFLRRSGKFTSLDITSEDAGAPLNLPSTEKLQESTKKVILVEEFPNMFMTSTNALQSFRSSVLQYLATNTPKDAVMPLIMIITESQTTGTTSLTETLTAHRLLGPSILNHPFTDTIEFNPIAPTFITKALNLVIQKEARHSGRRRTPGPSVLKRLSESGDARSAISSLEFLCLKGQDNENWSGRVRVGAKGKKGAMKTTASALTDMEEESLESVTRRESSLGLFHAVGKVVYNKRKTRPNFKTTQDPPTQPPIHLPQHARLKAPDVAVDELMDETGTDTATFAASLHENYVLSCSGEGFLDTLNSCVEALSDSDTLLSGIGRGGRGFRVGGGGNGGDAVRQDEMAWHVAVRGLLFGLPCPVKRSGFPSASGAAGRVRGREDAFKMFYPTSLRLGKRMLEIREGVERCVERMRNGRLNAATGSKEQEKENEVTSWARRTMVAGKAEDEETKMNGTVGACGIPSQPDLLRDMLPYMSIISQHRPLPLIPIEELNAITKVSVSTTIPTTDDESPDDLGIVDTVNRLADSEAAPSKQKISVSNMERGGKDALAVEQAVGKLYLSDDDIED
ncbi:MAG: hypothetical protein Q9226_001463 [Calogaya cf. arnoldii]